VRLDRAAQMLAEIVRGDLVAARDDFRTGRDAALAGALADALATRAASPAGRR
jgi:hypothetical protein